MAEQVFILDDFSGGLRYGFANQTVKITEGVVFENVLSMPHNYLRSRSGYVKKNTGGKPSKGAWINGVSQFWDADGSTHLICTTCEDVNNGVTGAGIFKFNDTSKDFTDLTGSTITWDPGPEDLAFFDSFGGYLVMVNGKNYPVVWDGKSSEVQQFGVNFSITGTNCIPKYVKAYKQFLFFGHTIEEGTTYPCRIRWCEPADITQWPENNYIDLDADDGDIITGMELISDYLAVFKERKIFIVGYSGGEQVFEARLVIDGRGCSSGASLTAIYNDLIFLAEDGIYSFDGTVNIEEISAKIKPLILEINPDKRHLVQSAPLEELDQLWFAIPYLSSEKNNRVLVLNYTNPDEECWYVYDIPCSTLGFYYRVGELTWEDMTEEWDSYDFKWDDRMMLAATSLLLSADYEGNLYDHNSGNNDDGSAFTSRWQSKYIDFGAPYLNKRLKRIILWVGKESEGKTLKVKLYKDYDELNPSEFTVNLYDSTFPNRNILERRIDMSEQAREFKLELYQDELNACWSVYKIAFIFDVKGRVIRT